jgi:hypothetical protein
MKRRFLPIRLIRSLPAVAGNPRLLFSRTKIARAMVASRRPEQGLITANQKETFQPES